MDVISYFLGKKSSGGGTGSIDVKARKIKFAYSSFQTFDTTGLDFSNCTDMSNMFQSCTELKITPEINSSKVTNMQNMFSSCNKLSTVTLFNTSNATNFQNMFYNCSVLQTIPLFNTSNVTTTRQMFNSCSSLKSIPLIDTSKVTDMAFMFGYCGNLETVPALNTSKVTNMQNMFVNDNKLTDESLDNVLQMCIGATSYTGTKKLSTLGITSATYYPASRIQGLTHYNDFINAGWTIGY